LVGDIASKGLHAGMQPRLRASAAVTAATSC
jgi:hypothetical protein